MEAAGGSRSRSGLRGTASLVTYGSRHEIEAKDVLQRMVVDAGGGLYGGGRVVAASHLVDPECKSPTTKRSGRLVSNANELAVAGDGNDLPDAAGCNQPTT